MTTIGAYEAGTHLSEPLLRVEKGEPIVITRHGTPIAELRPVAGRDSKRIAAAVKALAAFRSDHPADAAEIREQDSPQLIDALEALPIEVDGQTHSRAWTMTLGIAARHELSDYDAAYLELASRRNLPLATLDTRLAEACRAMSVEAVFSPDAGGPG